MYIYHQISSSYTYEGCHFPPTAKATFAKPFPEVRLLDIKVFIDYHKEVEGKPTQDD